MKNFRLLGSFGERRRVIGTCLPPLQRLFISVLKRLQKLLSLTICSGLTNIMPNFPDYTLVGQLLGMTEFDRNVLEDSTGSATSCKRTLNHKKDNTKMATLYLANLGAVGRSFDINELIFPYFFKFNFIYLFFDFIVVFLVSPVFQGLGGGDLKITYMRIMEQS
ncbi:hypothetical protein BDZ91DRAFT_211106 [Kalaharituber pfeilii]|nr:hypothetical protein BDZ91DRAFT_211106 [Kalaharituber pfeilii]